MNSIDNENIFDMCWHEKLLRPDEGANRAGPNYVCQDRGSTAYFKIRLFFNEGPT